MRVLLLGTPRGRRSGVVVVVATRGPLEGRGFERTCGAGRSDAPAGLLHRPAEGLEKLCGCAVLLSRIE